MANDLIEIPIEVRDRGSIRRVTQQLDEFGNTANNAQRSASAFVDNFERQAKATNKAIIANQRYAKSAQDFYRAQQEANLSNKSAEKSAMAFSSAINKSANSLRQLKAAIDPTYRSQQNLLQTKRVLREAVQRGNITMNEAVNTMRRYREAQIGMTTAGVGNTRSMNAMGMATQQAGYQVGDFLVQIQGGTNAFVAFGQQATQLVGILPMMAEQFNMNVNRLVGISSVLGIVIPLATALGAAFMRTRGAAEESSDSIEDFEQRLESARSSIKGMSEDLRLLQSGLQEGFQLTLQDEVVAAQKEVLKVQREINKAKENAAPSARQNLSILESELVAAKERLASAEAEQIAADAILAITEDRKKVSKEQSEIDEKIVDLAKEALSTYDEIQQSYQNEKKSLEQKIALLTVEKQFGEDSLAYKRLQNQQEEENYREQLKSLGLSQEQIGTLVQMLRTQQNITTEVGASTNQAQNLTNALSAASSVAAGLLARVGGVVQGLRDQVAAVEQGTSVSIVAMERQLRDLEDTRARLDAKGMDVSNIVKQIDKIRSGIEDAKKETVNLKNAQDSVASSFSSAGKAGSKAAKEIEKEMRTVNDVFQGAIVSAEDFEIQMAEGVVSAVDSVANAWGDFVMRGFQDFKGFVDSVWSSFKSLISDMISTAAKNRIMISLGMAGSGTGAAGAAGGLLGGGGGIANTLGSIGTSMAGGGFMGGVGSGLMGVLSGGGLGSSFANLGGMLSGSVGVTGGAIGAALPAAATVIGIPLLIAGLMKKTEVLVAEGVRARIDGATAELDSYEKTKTNNALGFSSGFSRDFTRLDDAVQNAVQTRLDTTIQALGAFGLGTDLGGFSFSERTEIKEGESFEGESEEVINEALNAAIEHLSNGALDMFQKTGESLSGTLDRLTTSIQTVNPIVDVMGGNILDVSLEGASAASALVDLVGGLEAFGSKSSFVFDNFLTDAEKMTIAEDRLGTAFENINNSIEGVNVSLPETHEAFLALKNSQDLSTEAGRQLHAALLEVAPQFVKVNGTAQEVADSVGNDLNPALDEFNVKGQTMRRLLLEEARLKGDTAYIREQEMEGLTDLEASVQQRIHDLKDEAATYKAIEDGANAALRAAQGALDIAQDNLRIAETGVDTAFDRLRVSIDSVVQRLETNLEGANERLGTSRRIFDLLASTVRDRRFGATQLSESNFGRARQSALGFLRSGDVTDERKLEDALRVVSEPSEGLFGSFNDYARDFFRTSSTIGDLEKTAGVQLNADEQAVVALEEQISQAESQMDVMREQYNTLLGIESGVLSIPDAISNLQGAFSNLTSAQTAVDTARADVGAAEEVAEVAESAPEELGPVEALYKSMLGRNPDTAGLEFWRGTGLSGKELVDAFRVGAIGQGEVPQFASGGAHTGGIRMVGEQGPELEVTGPARIYSNSQTSSMFRDPDLRESVNELKREVAGLRSETVQLQATNNKFTKRNYDLYRKWDVDGQPPQRT